ncbi:uncharacterized protein E0L32_005461 [Thyridium curvatum]|uniref:mannan endo-1,6-alpha-mannosidase n=1 Tax=Thyridium curvatum TaxID=1093900 RepID=A0A507B422_9PEZI|nr:uncharacterized protein E0L32_005461 [Thyridium curvatum]TPX14497.1 hypothetical protein E0L32_005461 [Thyridium curvatum]
MRGWRNAGSCLAALLLGAGQFVNAYDLDINSPASIKQVAASLTQDLASFYNGDKPGGTPGLLPDPYYWWEAGALMGTFVDYYYYTGDTKYNALTTQGLLFQVGPNNDYMPPNQTWTEGNDDQGFWGMAVMSAAEYKFPDPPPGKPGWLALAQAVFNTQVARWESQDCGGGLRWQIFTWNKGFTYKNSISQACFFNVAARLALYTGNQTYADWAEKTWDWMWAVKFIEHKTYYVYDGADISNNCTDIVPYQFSYNAGAFLLGAAAMYNFTEDAAKKEVWRERTSGLLNGTAVFFTGPKKDIMTEVACEPVNRCNVDQQSFKAYLSRWLAATTKWAPWSYDTIKPWLEASAQACVAQCTGGDNGRMCGLRWTDNGKWDGSTGVGQQMAAVEVVLANLIKDSGTPVTDNSGGTSQGDPSAGGSDIGRNDPFGTHTDWAPITAGDQAGAYILTIAVLVFLIAFVIFMMLDETSDKTTKERWGDFKHAIGAAPGAGAAVLSRRDKRGVVAEKAAAVERTDSDTSSNGKQRASQVVTFAPAAVATPPVAAARNSTSLHKKHRPTASDPGLLSMSGGASASAGAGYRRSADMQMGHSRAQSMGMPKRKPLRKSMRGSEYYGPAEGATSGSSAGGA